jgi:uncharacterized membrane protein YqgA involved in biofilm formation
LQSFKERKIPMPATFINAGLVILGSLIGLVFKNIISERFTSTITSALALCVMGIGISGMVGTEDTMCVIICMVVGTLIGEAINIERRLEGLGDLLRTKLVKGNESSRFTEGFVSACILFCIGSMTIMGSLEAGLRHNYSIIYAKSMLDFVSSMAFGAAMGFGVTCSALFVLVFQGALTLLAGVLGSALSEAAVTEMSAVGGVILIGMALNMLGCTRERIKVANMLPAIFLPILWFAVLK